MSPTIVILNYANREACLPGQHRTMKIVIADVHSEILRYLVLTLLCLGLPIFSVNWVKFQNFCPLLCYVGRDECK